ncbi:ANTAR domain-containing protein [Streptomyces zagrosensis]|uniref:ANTAR domain-containing protein n=1 Tax=Streptomyces zagrosensis TaxID=1042984 RepID=A0A7W9UZ92_9ACTN|nr:ANTAR domain-containing protein [Streptomyces zagrosensis]MBB5936151.1 hypothetical protein [Streptomyces zagrosensis]
MTDTCRTGAEVTEDDREELERLREEVHHLRARTVAWPLIAQAQGVVQERYRLADVESAFALLQHVSQRRNVKLRALAEALVAAPRPDENRDLWFPGRTRRVPPALDHLGLDDPGHLNRGAVLDAVLSQVLAITDTTMGNVQLADRPARGLRMAKHVGLNSDFVRFFHFVGADGTSCARAAKENRQITVHDVEQEPVFTEDARRVILAAGSKAAHSVPLTSDSGVCLGMVSAHLDHVLRPLSTAQIDAMERVGRQAGRWLFWYDRTVVIDALEYLHATARNSKAAPARRR